MKEAARLALQQPPRQQRRRFVFAGAATALTSGCATVAPRLSAVPEADQGRAQVPGFPDCRYVLGIDNDLRAMARDTVRGWERERLVHSGRGSLTATLALSGGGDDGAFGAGLLGGWSASGLRPEFKLVTGVSTGALIAPFAYLGPAYDERLREFYTKSRPEDILVIGSLSDILFGDAVADSSPLRARLASAVDRDLLDKVAAGYAEGRQLWVATTNLDNRRSVVWNLGRIATTPGNAAVVLFRNIMLASASIPGAFPPVMFDVEVNGERFQEMHVDGGTTAQVFTYPLSLDMASLRAEHGHRQAQQLFIIRNSRIDPDFEQVERRSYSIAGRAMSTLIRAQGLGDLYRIYLQAQRDGMGFHLAYIPGQFSFPKKTEFDTQYMNSLYALGFESARNGYKWSRVPPFYEPNYRYGTSSG